MSAGCGGCSRRWTSATQAHCQGCHEHFGSHGLADKHHTYGPNREQTCNDPRTQTTKAGLPVFRATDSGSGTVWRTYAQDARWAK